MAACVSKVNKCPFCVGAHCSTASIAYKDRCRVAAALADLDTAPIEEPLRSVLSLLERITSEGEAGVDDMQAARAAGASSRQIEDALAVCFVFNATNRLANTFGFEVLSPEGFDAGAKYLLKRGYR
jgi:AhpD family alkylhydroperoxidase